MDVVDRPSPNLVEVLRSTLENLEKSTAFSPDYAALHEFKRSIVRLIADLQLRKERKSNTPDWSTGKSVRLGGDADRKTRPKHRPALNRIGR